MPKPWEQYQSVTPEATKAPWEAFKPQEQARAGSALEAAGLGVAGGQLPFGNVITSGMAAGALTPFLGQGNEGMVDTYKRLYNEAQAYTKATQEAHPTATTVGNVAGIVSTLPSVFSKPVQGAGLIATPAKGLQGASDFASKMVSATPFKGSGIAAKAGNLAARSLGGASVAAPIGGLYAAGEADSGNRADAFREGAINAALIGGALPVAGAALGGALEGLGTMKIGAMARGEDALKAANQAIKDNSSNLYGLSESLGATLTPSAAQSVSSALTGIVKDSHTKASQKLYSGTLSAIQDLNDDLAAGNTGLMTLDKHRQILGNIAKDITNPNRTQEAEAADRAIEAIDNVINQLTPSSINNKSTEAIDALNMARSEWAKSKRFGKVSDIIINANGDANKLKRDLEKFRANPKNTLGWSDAEREALKTASTQTTGEGVLKLLGKFGFDLGSARAVGNTALPVIGGYVAGGGTGAVLAPLAGTVARSGQKLLAAGKAEDLLKVIEQGGNVSKQMIASLPQAERDKFISKVMSLPAAKANAILSTEKDKVK